MAERKETIPECCTGCQSWQEHGEGCFYYWELKKDCTMHSERK